MGIVGLGHDVVDVAAFAEQLAEPASRMRNLFSVREVRQALERARVKNDGEAVHLAAKWAGKEAFLKAWCESLGEGPYPFTLDDFPWREVEILDDSRGVPHVMLAAGAARAFYGGGLSSDGPYAGSRPSIHVSLSHDGPIASAMVVIGR
ncbi:holo-ACP synthase [Bifidobacterium olomucense]|uniref:Holo-[acyl-carrier-protein] synthase n=1 Tax=Bifidobacterium olomucense TaxID=2675324 RepID=A0A7Y0HXS1_9BIFI|nr:holo-ACP synthase [Bifidobacterium sp. DSM 109959]NMM98973.1 DNA-binding protein [Bifidobacterium sp. DSM 109959]